MRIDDVVVLGMAVPEERKDGRRTVCVAGYSAELGSMVRLYPVRPDAGLHRWDMISVTVERNPEDNRKESFKLRDSRGGWDRLNDQIAKVCVVKPDERAKLIDPLVDPCVGLINGERRSLGIVKARLIDRAYFADNPSAGREHQGAIPALADQHWVRTKADYPHEPRLAYRCGGCLSAHDQKVLDWGAFEWMRRGRGPEEQYWQNLRLYDPTYDLFVVVGNQANQRTSFLVIGIIPIKGEERALYGARQGVQATLFA